MICLFKSGSVAPSGGENQDHLNTTTTVFLLGAALFSSSHSVFIILVLSGDDHCSITSPQPIALDIC